MNAEGLLRDGRLNDAVERLRADLREDPTDSRSRTFLFELLCFRGEYDQARRHLEVLGAPGGEALAGAVAWQAVLAAEESRTRMFAANDVPPVATDSRPVRGTLNGTSFTSLTDSDERIGARLEAFAAGSYVLLPFETIAAVHIEKPQRLRDLLWLPARITLRPEAAAASGGEFLLPALYSGSFQHPDDNVRLGRMTDWCRDERGEVRPYGAKVLMAGSEEISLLDIRQLDFAREGAATG